MLRAVCKHAPEKWGVLYVERWLKALAQDEPGNQTARDKGTSQGGVMSPRTEWITCGFRASAPGSDRRS